MSLRLFIAAPPGLVLHGVKDAIDAADDIEVVGEAQQWSGVLDGIETSRPDIILLDSGLPGAAFFYTVDEIRRRYPDTKLVVLSDRSDEVYIYNVLQRGAAGYIVKTVDPRDLASALRQTAEGLVYHALAYRGADVAARSAGLTARELTILKCVARGLSNRAIATELHVTEQTVKFHLTNVYRKLGVHDRLGAARYAFDYGIASPAGDDDEPAGA
jgi:DNA-binding NarL/FixJ family response regulator